MQIFMTFQEGTISQFFGDGDRFVIASDSKISHCLRDGAVTLGTRKNRILSLHVALNGRLAPFMAEFGRCSATLTARF